MSEGAKRRVAVVVVGGWCGGRVVVKAVGECGKGEFVANVGVVMSVIVVGWS